jgi:hypothetical protein
MYFMPEASPPTAAYRRLPPTAAEHRPPSPLSLSLSLSIAAKQQGRLTIFLDFLRPSKYTFVKLKLQVKRS